MSRRCLRAERESARQEAQALFNLAASYAEWADRPSGLHGRGLMGSGKSTLAMALERELGWEVISSDITRTRLLAEKSAEALETASAGFGEGGYEKGWTNRTYTALVRAARSRVDEGRSVILDATWSRRAHRQRATTMAMKHGARPVFLACVCPRQITLERLARRWQAKASGALAPEAPSAASDGRPDLYDAQAASWQPYDPGKEPTLEYLAVDATQPVTVVLSLRKTNWRFLTASAGSKMRLEWLLRSLTGPRECARMASLLSAPTKQAARWKSAGSARLVAHAPEPGYAMRPRSTGT